MAEGPIARYFTSLDFLWTEHTLGPSLAKRRSYLTFLAYLLMSLGLFARQITAFPSVDMKWENLRYPVLLASFIIGLALFPPVMRWLNKRRPTPSAEHILMAFSTGFFVDLTNAKVIIPIFQSIHLH
jgi:hypothetical protein